MIDLSFHSAEDVHLMDEDVVFYLEKLASGQCSVFI